MNSIPEGFSNFTDFLNASEFYMQSKGIEVNLPEEFYHEDGLTKWGYEIREIDEGGITRFNLDPIPNNPNRDLKELQENLKIYLEEINEHTLSDSVLEKYDKFVIKNIVDYGYIIIDRNYIPRIIGNTESFYMEVGLFLTRYGIMSQEFLCEVFGTWSENGEELTAGYDTGLMYNVMNEILDKYKIKTKCESDSKSNDMDLIYTLDLSELIYKVG